VTPSSATYEVVFNFDIAKDGAFPSAVTLAPDGTLYGLDTGSSNGNLFHYTPTSGAFTTAAVNFPRFNGLPSHPATPLVVGPSGNLYGLYAIYAVSGEGLFEIHVDGSNLQLFPFYTTQNGGGSPDGLLRASDGNFWVADLNGKSGYGDIITLSPADGTLIQRLTPFSAPGVAGAYPAEIIQAKDGKLWGSTYQGGKAPQGFFSDGTVFSLNVGLPPR
jgi:outer membrane protein assembly factor BamB